MKLNKSSNKIRNKYKAILIFGPPGSGKTTQARLLGDKEFYLVSIGEFLRKLEKDNNFQKSALGKQVARLMASGQLIDDNIVIKLMFDEIEKKRREVSFNPEKQTLILDGVPRDVSQVDLIKDKILVEKVIYFLFPNDLILLNRIIKRTETDSRKEDTDIDVIKKRIALYNKKTKAVLKKYPKKIIFKIDGTDSIKKIHSKIMNILNKTKN